MPTTHTLEGIDQDLAAVDSMLTAAHDHLASAADATEPGTVLRSKIEETRQRVCRAASELAWLRIDVDRVLHPHAQQRAAG